MPADLEKATWFGPDLVGHHILRKDRGMQPDDEWTPVVDLIERVVGEDELLPAVVAGVRTMVRERTKWSSSTSPPEESSDVSIMSEACRRRSLKIFWEQFSATGWKCAAQSVVMYCLVWL